ncbi:DUF5988 family protein [Streptomyces telluris]|uniref:DUF5988 family protein n=1 Tax=Streptomyces telluris TaxID=2720021 RepID=A0A9X2LGY7_9ACTN|nr:DUF5988 family protein [Streptomyces telluris]MCQ8770677.1 DUF5988 family protein [Streptomyces telluris]NJP82062.1 hypothetical protein [Streptomyces telluris]
MATADKCVLQGGPEGLPEHIVPTAAPGEEVKVPFRGGYEHFRATSRQWDTAQGRLPVYEWVARTEVAE